MPDVPETVDVGTPPPPPQWGCDQPGPYNADIVGQKYCPFKLAFLYPSFNPINAKKAGADPGFLERGFVFINVRVWGFALLILSHFS